MNRFLTAVSFALALSPLAFCQQGDDPTAYRPVLNNRLPDTLIDPANFILYKSQAWLVGKPILICGPTASNPSWSPSGRYLLYQRSDGDENVLNIQDSVRNQKAPPPTDTLCVYSVAAGKSLDVLRFDQGTTHHEDVYWFTGADKALIQSFVQKPAAARGEDPSSGMKLYMFNAEDGSIKDFAPWTGEGTPVGITIFPSQSIPYAFVSATFEKMGTGPDGKPTPIGVEEQLNLVTANETFAQVQLKGGSPTGFWSNDGKRAYVL